MVSPKPQRSVFLDSSVLYAAAFSPTGPARRLILKELTGSIALSISDLVIEETKRNLAKNAPEALPYFTIIADLLSSQTTRPMKAEVLRAAQIVHLKDAPIVAAAAKAKADYLATHDVKHLLTHAKAIESAYGVTVLSPADLLSVLTNTKCQRSGKDSRCSGGVWLSHRRANYPAAVCALIPQLCQKAVETFSCC